LTFRLSARELDVELLAVGIVGGLGATVLAAAAGGRPVYPLAMLLGFVLAAWWLGTSRLPEPAFVGAVGALVSVGVLIWPRYRLPALFVGGGLAWIWGLALAVQGVPLAAAVGVALGVPAVVFPLATYHERFSSRIVVDEALVIVAGLGLLLATVPTITAGWDSAVALRAAPVDAGARPGRGWVLILALAIVLMGAAYSLWKRR
jgi:hypothetical protein